MKLPISRLEAYALEDLNSFQVRFYEFIKTLSYKPGTVFIVNPGKVDSLVNVQIQLAVDNLETGDRVVPLKGRVATFEEYQIYARGGFDSPDAQQYICEAVYTLIIEMETHEAQEWFHHNGSPVYNPHP